MAQEERRVDRLGALSSPTGVVVQVCSFSFRLWPCFIVVTRLLLFVEEVNAVLFSVHFSLSKK